MKPIRGSLIVLLGLVALLAPVPACGGFSQVERSASLTVANLSNFTICHVHVRPAGHRRPTADKLAPGDRITPHQARTVPIAAGTWHLQLADCARRPLYARDRIRIHGHRRLEFRPIDVQRDLMFGARRFAEAPSRAGDI